MPCLVKGACKISEGLNPQLCQSVTENEVNMDSCIYFQTSIETVLACSCKRSKWLQVNKWGVLLMGPFSVLESCHCKDCCKNRLMKLGVPIMPPSTVWCGNTYAVFGNCVCGCVCAWGHLTSPHHKHLVVVWYNVLWLCCVAYVLCVIHRGGDTWSSLGVLSCGVQWM